MKAERHLGSQLWLLLAVVAGSSSASETVTPGQLRFAGVAAQGNQLIGTVGGGMVSDEKAAIRLVGSRPPTSPVEAAVPARVVAMAVELEPVASPVAQPATAAMGQGKESAALPLVELKIPDSALWPDGGGVIYVRDEAVAASNASAMRNPWDIRVTPKTSINEFAMLYGGMVLGGAKPVAFVNGGSFCKDDRIGTFNVAAIRRGEVVVEANGIFYVLPLGRKITIRVPQTQAKR